jgi:uncharacterized membrane protein
MVVPRTGQLIDWVVARPQLVLKILIATSFGLFASYSILRHFALWTGFFDLGLYSNSIWRTINGYDSWNNLVFPASQGHINHFSPILAPVALAYYLFPDPITLLVIQAIALSSTTIPLYYLCRQESTDRLLPLLTAGLYLTNVGLFGIVRFDFHVESFIPIFVVLLYYSHRITNPTLFYTSIVLLLATIEYSAVIGLGITLSLWIRQKRLDRRLIVLGIASATTLAVIVVSTLGVSTSAFGWPANWLSKHYVGNVTTTSGGYLQSPANLLANPISLLNAIGYDFGLKLVYLALILAPVWQATVRHFIRLLPALPWLIIVFVSSRLEFFSPYFQYSAFLIPFVSLAAIPYVKRLTRKRQLVLAMLSLTIFTSFLAVSPTLTATWPTPDPNLTAEVHSMAQTFPLNASILTQNDLFAQIPNRPYLAMKYDPSKPPDYILIDKNSGGYDWTSEREGYPLSVHQQIDQLFTQHSYLLLQSYHGLELYKLQST